MTVRHVQALIFVGATLIFLGLAVAMAYESVAIWTAKELTISKITANAVRGNPVWTGVACFLAGGIVFGLLVHFTGWDA